MGYDEKYDEVVEVAYNYADTCARSFAVAVCEELGINGPSDELVNWVSDSIVSAIAEGIAEGK